MKVSYPSFCRFPFLFAGFSSSLCKFPFPLIKMPLSLYAGLFSRCRFVSSLVAGFLSLFAGFFSICNVKAICNCVSRTFSCLTCKQISNRRIPSKLSTIVSSLSRCRLLLLAFLLLLICIHVRQEHVLRTQFHGQFLLAHFLFTKSGFHYYSYSLV